MIGDKYQVFYCIAGRTVSHPSGPWDAWQDAKAERNHVFYVYPGVEACWIMRSNPSLGLRQEKYGNVMRNTSN